MDYVFPGIASFHQASKNLAWKNGIAQ